MADSAQHAAVPVLHWPLAVDLPGDCKAHHIALGMSNVKTQASAH